VRRILYVHSSADRYGSDLSLLRLVTSLGDGYEPVVVLATDGPLVEMLRRHGVETHVLPLAVLRRRGRLAPIVAAWVAAMPAMIRLIRRTRPALVHSNSLAVAEGACAARLLGVPHVWHVRELVPQPRMFRSVLAALALLTSQRVIAISRPVADWFAGGGRLRQRTVVIHNGREYSAAEPRAVRTATVEEPLTLALIARLTTWKGHSLVLRAVARLEPSLRDRLRVVFAGDVFPGKEDVETDLRKEALALGVAERVDFVGYVASSTILAGSDAVLIASETPEPFGNVMLEAMEVGLPIIATAQGGPLDVVVDGETGLLVAPEPQAIAGAIARFVEDGELRARLGRAGQARARRHFTQERTTSRVLAVYDDVLGPRGEG
jgi:glycosyltransferase involved in cell wall biosynthesis